MTEPKCNPSDHESTGSSGQNESGGEETEPKLSRRQMRALPIVAAAPNLTQAAQEAGIGEATLRRWHRDEHFRAEMAHLTHEIAETTRQRLRDVISPRESQEIPEQRPLQRTGPSNDVICAT